ncbi:WD40 repeat domain-containing protein [Mucilaginibacter flavidus]|uniref:WD40 repeat domain-containing protein n=1 Tax=Mucilaginibacter flavidus TaxID=2949309 RepID=UPI002092B501|nr:WD40 repeat domain-containing protein [Mucilaginibacter flavidus]MCO5948962.1 WD40 repeat domain-containing protein [Mucilaginibacter flavidus]
MTVEKTAELTGHGNPIFTLELSQKPGILFTGGNDKGLVEWSLKDNSFIKVMFPVAASIYAIHGPVGLPLLFTGLRNGDVLVFDFMKQQLQPALKHHQKPIFDIKSVDKKRELLVASEDGTVSVWSMETFELLHTIKVSNDTIRCIAISPDEKQVAFGCRNNHIHIYDLEDYSLLKTLDGHTMSVFSLQYSPDSTHLVSGGRDAQVKVWDTVSYKLLHNIPAHLFAVNSIAFHKEQPYFATGSMDKTIKIWGADDFKLYKNISREKGYASHQLSINKLAWNGNQLLSVSDDKKVIVWEVNFGS